MYINLKELELMLLAGKHILEQVVFNKDLEYWLFNGMGS